MFRPFVRAAVLLVAVLLACAASHSSASAAPQQAPDAEVRAALDSLNSACVRRDTTAFMSLFDDGDEILVVGSDTGEVFHGRAEVARFRGFLFRMPFVFSFDLARVTIRREGRFAWAYVDGDMLHTRDDGKVSRRPYRYSLALVQRGSAWKMQMFHGSVPGGE
jgi:ketosteroid isomerase-like protein